jgi:hypothetical protein
LLIDEHFALYCYKPTRRLICWKLFVKWYEVLPCWFFLQLLQIHLLGLLDFSVPLNHLLVSQMWIVIKSYFLRFIQFLTRLGMHSNSKFIGHNHFFFKYSILVIRALELVNSHRIVRLVVIILDNLGLFSWVLEISFFFLLLLKHKIVFIYLNIVRVQELLRRRYYIYSSILKNYSLLAVSVLEFTPKHIVCLFHCLLSIVHWWYFLRFASFIVIGWAHFGFTVVLLVSFEWGSNDLTLVWKGMLRCLHHLFNNVGLL